MKWLKHFSLIFFFTLLGSQLNAMDPVELSPFSEPNVESDRGFNEFDSEQDEAGSDGLDPRQNSTFRDTSSQFSSGSSNQFGLNPIHREGDSSLPVVDNDALTASSIDVHEYDQSPLTEAQLRRGSGPIQGEDWFTPNSVRFSVDQARKEAESSQAQFEQQQREHQEFLKRMESERQQEAAEQSHITAKQKRRIEATEKAAKKAQAQVDEKDGNHKRSQLEIEELNAQLIKQQAELVELQGNSFRSSPQYKIDDASARVRTIAREKGLKEGRLRVQARELNSLRQVALEKQEAYEQRVKDAGIVKQEVLDASEAERQARIEEKTLEVQKLRSIVEKKQTEYESLLQQEVQLQQQAEAARVEAERLQQEENARQAALEQRREEFAARVKVRQEAEAQQRRDNINTNLKEWGSRAKESYAQKQEAARIEADRQAKQERLAKEQAAREEAARQEIERQRLRAELQARAERVAQAQAEAEAERLQREKAQAERVLREAEQAERLAQIQAEAEARLAEEAAAQERFEAQQKALELERIEKARVLEEQRLKAEAEARATQEAAQIKKEAERAVELERIEKARVLEEQRLEAQRLERERIKLEEAAAQQKNLLQHLSRPARPLPKIIEEVADVTALVSSSDTQRTLVKNYLGLQAMFAQQAATAQAIVSTTSATGQSSPSQTAQLTATVQTLTAQGQQLAQEQQQAQEDVSTLKDLNEEVIQKLDAYLSGLAVEEQTPEIREKIAQIEAHKADLMSEQTSLDEYQNSLSSASSRNEEIIQSYMQELDDIKEEDDLDANSEELSVEENETEPESSEDQTDEDDEDNEEDEELPEDDMKEEKECGNNMEEAMNLGLELTSIVNELREVQEALSFDSQALRARIKNSVEVIIGNTSRQVADFSDNVNSVDGLINLINQGKERTSTDEVFDEGQRAQIADPFNRIGRYLARLDKALALIKDKIEELEKEKPQDSDKPICQMLARMLTVLNNRVEKAQKTLDNLKDRNATNLYLIKMTS